MRQRVPTQQEIDLVDLYEHLDSWEQAIAKLPDGDSTVYLKGNYMLIFSYDSAGQIIAGNIYNEHEELVYSTNVIPVLTKRLQEIS